MKPFVAMFALLTIGAAAQETAQPGISTVSAPAMGKTVKGAPYWADEITESLQVLADGTRISHQSKATVYRDSLGRVRRESPDKITIFDTVTGYSYTLDPKSMTVERLTMGTLLMNRQKLFFFRKSAAPSPEATAKAKAELDANVAELKARHRDHRDRRSRQRPAHPYCLRNLDLARLTDCTYDQTHRSANRRRDLPPRQRACWRTCGQPVRSARGL